MNAHAPVNPRKDPRADVLQSPSLAISNQIVHLLSRYTGRGPTKARTTLTRDAVMVVLHDSLTRGERTLVAGGQPEAVRRMRATFHDLLREEASTAVENVLGRRVTAFLADTDPNAHVAAFVFTLAPQSETDAPDTHHQPSGGVAAA